MDLLQRLRQGLGSTRSVLGDRLAEAGDSLSAEALEEVLIAADVGLEVAEETAGSFERARRRGGIAPGGEVAWIEARFLEVLRGAEVPVERGNPHVVLMVGVNGTGKTTSAAKLAARTQQAGRKVMLVAADTFRAAAVEQLQRWGEKVEVPVISQRPGADPGAVVFDALQAAQAGDVSDVIVDTAGRLHTKHNLMAELEKVKRVCGRAVPGSPHELLLVLDATTGSNGVAQAREFRSRVGVTGVVLTKLDGTAKGGVALAVASELKVPVRWIGIGEGVDDLLPFDCALFVRALLEGLR